MNCDIIDITMCLSDLDASEFFTSEKTGKKYLNFKVAGRREPDRYGNEISIAYKKKNKSDETKYIKGSSGKMFSFDRPQAQPTPQPVASAPVNNSYQSDDLPF